MKQDTTGIEQYTSASTLDFSLRLTYLGGKACEECETFHDQAENEGF